MKPNDFSAALMELSGLVNSPMIADIATVFAQSPEKTSAATIKKLAQLPKFGAMPSELVAVFKKASAFAARTGGAKFSALLILLEDALGSTDAATAIAHLNAPRTSRAVVDARPDVVRSFVNRLEESLGDEGFSIPYRQLELDKTISNAEVIVIAKTFADKKTTSRPKALQAIWARHHSLLGFRAKSDSRSGRSAA
jgi:hypothetical protein